MSGIYCYTCFKDGIHDHPKGNCPNGWWLDSPCACQEGVEVSKWCPIHGTDEHSWGAREDCSMYSVKDDPAIGIDPDYDNKIPEAKEFTVRDLVYRLNKETFLSDPKWGVYIEERWDWGGDYISEHSSGFRLQFDKKDVGILQGGDYKTKFDNIMLLDDATVYQARFIRECTGWSVEV